MNAWIPWIAWAALVGLIAWRTWIALRAAGRQTDRIIRETLEPADLDAGRDRLLQAIQDHREDQP